MSIDYTTRKLCSQIRKLVTIPNSPYTYNDTDMCDTMTQVLQTYLVSLYKSQVQEFLVETHLLPFDPSVTEYYIPTTAINGELRDFALLDLQGNPKYVNKIDPSQIKAYGLGSSITAMQYPCYYVENDKIVLWWGSNSTPASNQGWSSVKFSIYRMPNVLVTPEQSAKILTVAGNVITVSVNNVPDGWVVGTKVDFIKGTPQFSGKGVEEIEGWEITDISGTQITFDEIPDGLAEGDWLSEVGTSPIPMVPLTSHNLLVAAAAWQIIGPGLSHPKAQLVQKLVQDREKMLIPLMNRNDAQPVQLNHRGSIGRFR